MPPPAEIAAALRGNHRYASRLLFLSADLETVLHEVPGRLLDGSVEMQRGREVRRSARVTLLDDGTLYAPLSPASLVWPNRPVRIERGVYVGTAPTYVPLITGLLDEPSVSEREGKVGFTVWSRLRLADQQFTEPVVFEAETRLRAVIRRICELAGMGTADTLYDLEDGGTTLGAIRVVVEADNMLRTAHELAFAHGLELYDDGLGRTVLRSHIDPATVAVAWDFAPGALSTLNELERTLQGRPVYNRARVRSLAPDGYPLYAEAVVTNPQDPMFWTPATDRPGPLRVIEESLSQFALNAVARALLIEGALADEVGQGSSSPLPGLEAGEVVTQAGVRARLDSVTHPLRGGSTTFGWTSARSLV